MFWNHLFETHQDDQDARKEGFPLKIGLLLLDEHSEVRDNMEQGDKDHGDGTGCKHPPGAPVLEIDAHGAHVRRTKESWEDQKAG